MGFLRLQLYALLTKEAEESYEPRLSADSVMTVGVLSTPSFQELALCDPVG